MNTYNTDNIYKNIILCFLCSIFFISCAQKLDKYRGEIESVKAPTELLKLSSKIVKDDDLSPSVKTTLLLDVSSKSLIFFPVYMKYLTVGRIDRNSREVLALMNVWRFMINSPFLVGEDNTNDLHKRLLALLSRY